MSEKGRLNIKALVSHRLIMIRCISSREAYKGCCSAVAVTSDALRSICPKRCCLKVSLPEVELVLRRKGDTRFLAVSSPWPIYASPNARVPFANLGIVVTSNFHEPLNFPSCHCHFPTRVQHQDTAVSSTQQYLPPLLFLYPPRRPCPPP